MEELINLVGVEFSCEEIKLLEMLKPCQGREVSYTRLVKHEEHVLDEGAKLGCHLQLVVLVEVVLLRREKVLEGRSRGKSSMKEIFAR